MLEAAEVLYFVLQEQPDESVLCLRIEEACRLEILSLTWRNFADLQFPVWPHPHRIGE